MTSLPTQIAGAVPVQVLERRTVPRISISDLNEMDLDQLRDRLANSRRDDRPAVVKVLDLLDAPRNKLIANVFPTLEREARMRGETATGGTGRVTGSDLLKAAGIENRIVSAVAGFGLDVLTDPLTYLGPAGWGAQAGKVAIRKGGQRALKGGMKAAATGGLGAVQDDAVRGLIEASGFTAPRLDRLRMAEQAGRLKPGHTVAGAIEKRIKGDPTDGIVGGVLAWVGGDRGSSGGVLGRALETTAGAGPVSTKQIESARKFAAKYGRGTGPAAKIGVPEGQVGSEVAHIPFTDFTLQVPAFTPVAKQASVAQGVYRDKRLGLDLLKEIPVVGVAHQAVQSMRQALDSLESESAGYAKLERALQARIDDGDNTAIDALRQLQEDRRASFERSRFAIDSLQRQATEASREAAKMMAGDVSKFGPDAMLALGDMQREARLQAAAFSAQGALLEDASKIAASTRSAAEKATKAQTGPLEDLLRIQESTRRGFKMNQRTIAASGNEAPASASLDDLVPITAKAKAERIADLVAEMKKLPGQEKNPLWSKYADEVFLLEARPVLGSRKIQVAGDDTSQFSRPYLNISPDGRPTITANPEVRAKVLAEIRPLTVELDEALKQHKAIQADTQGGLFAGADAGTAPRLAAEMSIADLRKIADPNVPIERLRAEERPYLSNLKAKIRAEGLQQPIDILVKDGKPYKIWDGMHRLAVLDELNYKAVPVRYVDSSGQPLAVAADSLEAGEDAAAFASEYARSEAAIAEIRDRLTAATAPLRSGDQVPVDEWIDSIREANIQRSSSKAIKMMSDIAEDPAGTAAMKDALFAANTVTADYARALDGVISQFATGPQKDAAEAVRYAIGASDITAGYSLTTPLATVAKNLFRAGGMSDESFAFKTIDAIARSKRRVFGQRKGDQVRDLAKVRSRMRDEAMIANRDATEEAIRSLRSIENEFGLGPSAEGEFRWYALAKTIIEANKRDGVANPFKIAQGGKLVDSPMIEWMRKFVESPAFSGAKPGLAQAVDQWASKTVDTLHALRDAELEDGLLDSVLPGYVMSGLTPQGSRAARLRAKEPGFRRGSAVGKGEEGFQRPRTTLKALYQSPTTGEWRQFYEMDRWTAELTPAQLETMAREDPKGFASVSEMREAIAEYDNLPADAKPPMVAADPFELNQQYSDHGRFRAITGSDPSVDRFFETDVALLLGSRLAQHTRAVAKADFRNILSETGIQVDAAAIERVSRVASEELESPAGAKVRVIGNVKTPGGGRSPLLRINGSNYRFLSPDTIKAHDSPIMDAMGEDLLGRAYPEQIADVIDDIAAYTTKTTDWLDHLNRATGIWKTTTLFHPSWVVSNVIGDTTNAIAGLLAAGGNPAQFFKNLPTLIKIRNAKGNPEKLAQLSLRVGEQTLSGQQLVDMFSNYRAYNDNAVAEIMYQLIQNGQFKLPSHRGVPGAGMSEDLKFLTNAYAQPLKGLGKGGVAIAKGAAGIRVGMDRLSRNVVSPFMHANAFVSDVMRSAAMIAHMENGSDAGAAANRMIGSLFDYSDFSRIEERVLRQLFPFYSWMRNNLSYQMQLLMERPAYAANFPRLKEMIEEMVAGDEAVPENMRPKWMQSQLALQIGADPSSRFAFMLGNTIPTADALNVLTPVLGEEGVQHFGKYFVSGLNPLIGGPLQVGAGTEFFSGRSIGTDGTADLTPTEFAARQIRPLSELGLPGTGIDGKIPDAFSRGFGQGVARTVLGGRVQAFDAERLRTSRLAEFKNEEEGLRRQIRRAERLGDKESSLAGRANLIMLYEGMAQAGLEDEIPAWAREQIPMLRAE